MKKGKVLLQDEVDYDNVLQQMKNNHGWGDLSSQRMSDFEDSVHYTETNDTNNYIEQFSKYMDGVKTGLIDEVEKVDLGNATKYDMKNPKDREEFNKDKVTLSSDEINTDDDGNIILTKEGLDNLIKNYGKIDLSESEIMSILEETQNPIMSKSELIESISYNLLNESDMDNSVRQSFESGNNDYSEHLDANTINSVANQAFEEVRNNIREKTGNNNVSLNDVQELLGTSLMAAAKQEYNYGIENLEQKAVQMIRKQFKIPKDAVEFDVEITGLPPMMLVGRPNITPQESERISQQIGAKVGKIEKGNLQYEKGNTRPPQGKSEGDFKPMVTRRRFTNAMMHGAARKSQNLHHMDDQLRQNNPQLGSHYANIMSANDASYWMMSDESIKEQGRQGVHAGNVRVELSREEGGKPKIIAQGIVFPILLHELAKGVVELMSLWSLPKDLEERKYVLSQTDHLGAETNDIRLGPSLWSKFMAEIPVDNQEVISLTWHKMQELSDNEFNGIVEGLLGDQEQARNTVRDIANESIEELREEEYNDAIGYDESEGEGPEGEGPEGEGPEGEHSDPLLDDLLSGGTDEPEDNEVIDYSKWGTTDLRVEFDKALDSGDMELVRTIGDILGSR